MKSEVLREKFIKFFENRGHKIVPSSSLIPEDKTVLLTSAGMQQFVPYLTGEKDVLKDFGNRHLASIQKCFRTPDIEEVGDDTHHTFFEMLGNWSIGEDPERGYFKEGAIKLALEFFVDELGLDKNRFWITIFKGEAGIPRDNESFNIWQKYGIPKERIVEFGLKDNFWGPTAETGPCGPCSEIHYDRGEKYGCGDINCGPNCEKCKRFVELWNLVFMEYYREGDGSYRKMTQRNVDTGIGFERLTAVLQGKDSAYETDLFSSLIEELERLSGKSYDEEKRVFRIISDHLRGAVFLISDGVRPSNIERGYVLRRILRRMVRFARKLDFQKEWYKDLIVKTQEIYGDFYPEIKNEEIFEVIKEEENKFLKTLEKGLAELNHLLRSKTKTAKEKIITGEEAFNLYQSYGFPLELTEEIAKEKDWWIGKDLRWLRRGIKKFRAVAQRKNLVG
jgi:alanyl-tRNA synthetase